MRIPSTILCVFLVCSLGYPQNSSPQKAVIGTGPWWRNPDFVRQLTLTDKQTEKLEQTLANHSSRLSDLNAEYQKLRVQLGSLFHSEGKNEELSSTIDKLAQNRARAISEGYLLWMDERTILTAEQWRKMMALRDASHYEAAPSVGSSPK